MSRSEPPRDSLDVDAELVDGWLDGRSDDDADEAPPGGGRTTLFCGAGATLVVRGRPVGGVD